MRFTNTMRNYLKFLQHHLVLEPVDKASNNIAFECKNAYVNMLQTELNDIDGAYNVVDNKTQQEILDTHKTVLKPMQLWSDSESMFGYIYSSIKFHKDGRRFIAGMHKCSTTTLSSILSDVLNHILQTLRIKDDRSIRETGVRRFFVVKGYEEVADFFKTWWFPGEVKHTVDSADFATAYTSTPLDDLKSKLKLVIEEAWNFEADEKGLERDRTEN